MSSLLFLRRKVGPAMAVVLVVLGLAACELAKNQIEYDRPAEASFQDYRDTLAPVKLGEQPEAEIPDFQPLVSTPEELRLPTPLVTVSVNQTVALRDLLFELAEQAGVDVEMDPQIRGSIIFTANERPFDEVIQRISDMVGLRHRYQNNVLRLELDRPYVKQYNVDFINVVRTGTSSVQTTAILGGAGGGGNAGGSTSGGSNSNIEAEYDGNLWEDLEENVEQILTSSDTYISLATLADPVATPINPAPPAPAVNPDGSPAPPPLPGSPETSAMPAAAAPTLNIMSAPAEPLIPNPPATYSISRQSGVLSVFASERQHKEIDIFLKRFRKRAMTQILIEAKVLQVELTDEYATGINWTSVDLTGLVRVEPDFLQPTFQPAPVGNFTGVFETGNFASVVQAVSRFGTVRALSAPRVTVLNNQPAVVNVATDNVYFTYDVETTQDEDTNINRVSITSEQKSAPEGVLLNVVPHANPDTGEMTMIVRPTISKIRARITDPVIPFSLATLGIDPTAVNVPNNQVPEVAIQEIDSMLKMQSGQVVVMGGLMQDENTVEEESVPILGEIPLIGQAFKNHIDRVVKNELVILIRAQIISGSNMDDTDRKVYKRFGLDRRPARL